MIECAFGLGEAVVSGAVSPDRYVVAKEGLRIEQREVRRKELAIEFSTRRWRRAPVSCTARSPSNRVLSDEEVREVASLGMRIAAHYGSPQDTEWAIDAGGSIWMLQSRPVTVAAPAEVEPEPDPAIAAGPALLRGLGAAPGAGSGQVRVVGSREDAARLLDGEILVTHMTSPDWVPLMRRAAAIVTDSGGMTCHAAIVSRELGIPCLVGTAKATTELHDGQEVTVDAGAGTVTEGATVPAGVISRKRRRHRGRGADSSPARSFSSTCPSPRSCNASPPSTSTASAC